MVNSWQEDHFYTFDGVKLFYRHKQPTISTDKFLLVLHRGHEHSGRVQEIADVLSDGKYACFAMDMRGHGQSEGVTAWAENFDVWVRDINSFSGHIRYKYNLELSNCIVVANSVGSVVVARWLLNYGAQIRGCILGAPAFSIRLYIPLALPVLKLVNKISRHLFVTSYVKPGLLTRNKEEAVAYKEDKLITSKIGVSVLVTLFDAAENIFKRLRDFETPVLLLTAENDYIVRNKHHAQFIEGISSRYKKHVILPNYRHAIFHENERQIVEGHCHAFIKEFMEGRSNFPLPLTEPRKHTVVEYQALVSGNSFVKSFYYSVFSYLLKTVGRASNGVCIGLEYGFDSGISLDYVYQNRAQGRWLIGRMMDRLYLDSAGWRGVRSRKSNLKETLIHVLSSLNDGGIKPVVFDVAAGSGRYLLELQQELKFPFEIIMNDADERVVRYSKEMAVQFNAHDYCHRQDDVFNCDFENADFMGRVNVVVISGLCELYENNNLVQNLLYRLCNRMQHKAYIVYTGQPWHPQLDLIAGILNNRHGKRWIMRRRIQVEMDSLVAAAGFEKVNTISENLGIFNVSCAIKR